MVKSLLTGTISDDGTTAYSAQFPPRRLSTTTRRFLINRPRKPPPDASTMPTPSKPGVAVWDKYIEQIKKPTKPWIIGKHLEVMNSTGPIALSKSVAKSSGVYGTLPTKLLSPCSICEVDSCNKHGTMMRQLTGKSWHSIDSTIYNAIFCNFWYIMLGLVFIIVVVWAIRRARS